MGWPLDESYSASSGVDNAWRLQGHLLMVVGELDENVDPSSTLQVVNALIQARKDFDLIVAPGLGHTALRSSGPIDYGLRRQYDFFLRHLAGDATGPSASVSAKLATDAASFARSRADPLVRCRPPGRPLVDRLG